MTGTDLRPFQVNHQFYPPHIAIGGIVNWRQVTGPVQHIEPFLYPPYDFIVSLSAIEHFGLGYYEGDSLARLDLVAMQLAHKWLKDNGRFYLTVPIGEHMITEHWRRYNSDGIKELLDGWIIETAKAYKLKWILLDEKTRHARGEAEEVPMSEAYADSGHGCTHEALFVLKKR